ncbi:MAG: RES family NAD+ phosphorylase [Oscillospiraceae bacterium]
MYRCRTHENDEWRTAYADFAPPPPWVATSGRMNATGINVLYLTLDPNTALCETRTSGRDYATIASFRVTESIRVLDLTKIKKMSIPSIFDEDNRHNRSPVMFLQKFAENISQPRSNKNIDIEYVPTQIVTEFFRYVKTSRSNGYAGILYESTQNPGGECLALFLTRDEVLNHKYGIHIIPKATTYHKKEYVTVDNNSTLIAKGKIHIDSLANEKVSELVKKQKIPKETIESIVKRTEQK